MYLNASKEYTAFDFSYIQQYCMMHRIRYLQTRVQQHMPPMVNAKLKSKKLSAPPLQHLLLQIKRNIY